VKVELFLGWRSNEMRDSFDEKISMTAILVEGFDAMGVGGNARPCLRGNQPHA
jgi:hypothetical protein